MFVLFYIFVQIISACSNLWLNDWITENKKNLHTTEDSKMYRLTIYILIGSTQCFASLLGETFHTIMFIRAVKYLHSSLLFSILRSSMKFFESTPSGRIINRFNKDIEATENSIPFTLKDLAYCLFNLIAIITVISFTTPLFIFSFCPIVLLYLAIQRFYIRSSRQLKRLDSVSKSPIFSHFSESLSGVSSIRAFKSEKRFIEKMQDLIDENLIYFYPNYTTQRWLSIRLEILGHLITLFACLFAIIARDSITAGLAGLSITYSLSVSGSLTWFVRQTSEFESNITSIERINEYCHTPHEAEWSIEETKPVEEWPSSGQIQFKNYSLKYRPELDYVLRDLNMDIKPGEKIGIVGRTGAGKSSLTLGLFRMLENHTGEIIIDNVNIHNIGLHDLRQKITIIPQVCSQLFSRSFYRINNKKL